MKKKRKPNLASIEAEIRAKTKKCYDKAKILALNSLEMSNMRQLMVNRYELTDPEYGFNMMVEEEKRIIGEFYLRQICALPTKTLQNIILLHENDLMYRFPKTIEVILTELTRRALVKEIYGRE